MSQELVSEISSITGLQPQELQSQFGLGDPQKASIEAITGTKLDPSKYSAPNPDATSPLQALSRQIDLTNVYTDPISSYTKYGVPLSPFVDWNEERALRQSTGQKWANGLMKAGITTLGAVYENTVGVFAGLGELATGGSYYDNFVGKQVDEVNNWAQKNLPNYYTQAEEKAGVLEGLGTANFWADKVANGLGYTLGSIATMWLGTGELGLVGRAIGGTAKAASQAGKLMGIGGKTLSVLDDAAMLGSRQLALYKAGKAIATGEKLERLSKIARISTASQRLAVATQMSLAEASVEARETKNRYIEEQTAKWKEENPGQEVPEDVMNGIMESADAAGNTAFAINLPILATSNLIMFNKMFKGASIGESQMYKAERDAAGKLVEAGMDSKFSKILTKSQRLFGKTAENMVNEGFQEGSQFAASEFSRSYYGDKFSDGVGDMAKSISESLSKTIGSKEGLENILIGAIVGGGTGTVSRIAGADRKLAKTRTANTAKVLEYINNGGLTKAIENMDNNEYNIALVNQIEANNKIYEAEESTPVQKAIAKQRAERARVQLIRSEVARLDKMGATDYLMEQLDDAAAMPEDDFKAAFGYRKNATIQQQTGKTQTELVQDIKEKAELSLKRSRQVQDILAKYQPKNTLLPKLLASFQSEETKNNKDLQRLVRNEYANMLHAGLIDIDVLDSQIDDIYDHLVKVAPALAQMPKEDFVYRVKVGKVNIKEDGTFSFSSKTTAGAEEKLYAKLNEIFQAKHALNPADAEDFQNAAFELANLVGRRERLTQAFDNIRRNPENMDLYVEAEQLRRKADQDKANADRAVQVIENAETADELRDAMPEDAPEEIIAQAEARVEELEQAEKEEAVKFTTLSDAQLDAINEDDLPPIAASALAKEKDKREKKRRAENSIENEPGQLQRRTDFAPTASFEEVQQELSDAEAAAFFDISVSPGGFIFTIGGRAYLNLNDEPLDALIYDENGERVGVKLTDAATGNEITWMLSAENETDSAIADSITYSILLQAASIRDVESQRNISVAEAQEINRIRGGVIAEDVTQKHRAELEAERENLKGKNKKLEIPATEDPEALAQAEAEFEKLVALSDIGKTAELTDGQIRAQIEVIKQDLIEIEEILEAERQLAMESGFTKQEFNQDGQVKTLKAIKKSHKALLTRKIKELAARKKAAVAETTQTEEAKEAIVEEIEQAPTEEEVDEITRGEQSKISRIEDEITNFKVIASELQKIIDGTYPGQDVEAAEKELRNTESKIRQREESIRKSKELIQRINEERESEKLRQNGNVAEGTDTTAEGQESEGTNIDPREGSTSEGLDGTTTDEELEALRRKREELDRIDKTMDNPEDGPTDTQEDDFVETVVVSEGNIDAPLAKGEVKSSPDFREQIVDDNGNTQSVMIRQKVEGDTVMVFPDMLTDNSVVPTGTVVTFEVDESTDWWNSEDPSTSNNKKDLTEDRYWEQVPIYIVAIVNGNPERIGMLAAYNGTTGISRQEIYNLFKKGLAPSATIDRKLFNSTNVVNARTESVIDQNGNVIPGDIFFYPASQLVKPGQSPTIAVVRLKDNIPVLVDQNGNELPFEAGNLALGQVAMVVEDPNGNPAIIVASTKDMTEEGRTIAVNHLIKESPEANLFGEIVGLNKLPVEIADENDAIEYSETEDPTKFNYEKFMSQVTLTDGRALFTFYSKSAKKLVRINEEELKKALLGQSFIFSFSEAARNERGWNTLVTVQEDKSMYPAVAPNLKQEFLDIIMQKKFQVSIDRMGNTEAYVSPITGIEYPSYFDYLTSTQEFDGQPRTEGKGANVILATDSPGNAYKSPFYDVGIEFSRLSAANGNTGTRTEIQTNEAVRSLDSIDSQAPTAAPKTNVEQLIEGLERERTKRTAQYTVVIEDPSSPSSIVEIAKSVKAQIDAAYDKQIEDLRKSQPASQPQPSAPAPSTDAKANVEKIGIAALENIKITYNAFNDNSTADNTFHALEYLNELGIIPNRPKRISYTTKNTAGALLRDDLREDFLYHLVLGARADLNEIIPYLAQKANLLDAKNKAYLSVLIDYYNTKLVESKKDIDKYFSSSQYQKDKANGAVYLLAMLSEKERVDRGFLTPLNVENAYDIFRKYNQEYSIKLIRNASSEEDRNQKEELLNEIENIIINNTEKKIKSTAIYEKVVSASPTATTTTTQTTTAQPAPAATPVIQDASQINTEEWDADLFGAAPAVEQKPVSLETELPPALAHLRPSPEKAAQLLAEMQAEMRGLNPNGAPMQDLGEEIRNRCGG